MYAHFKSHQQEQEEINTMLYSKQKKNHSNYHNYYNNSFHYQPTDQQTNQPTKRQHQHPAPRSGRQPHKWCTWRPPCSCFLTTCSGFDYYATSWFCVFQRKKGTRNRFCFWTGIWWNVYMIALYVLAVRLLLYTLERTISISVFHKRKTFLI